MGFHYISIGLHELGGHLGEVNQKKKQLRKTVKDVEHVKQILASALTYREMPKRWMNVLVRSFQRSALRQLKPGEAP